MQPSSQVVLIGCRLEINKLSFPYKLCHSTAIFFSNNQIYVIVDVIQEDHRFLFASYIP